MSIAELLVQTTATLRASQGHGRSHHEFADAARQIVAEFYGPACSRMTILHIDHVDMGMRIPPMPVKRHQESSAGRKHDECSTCGWPRGEHR